MYLRSAYYQDFYFLQYFTKLFVVKHFCEILQIYKFVQQILLNFSRYSQTCM